MLSNNGTDTASVYVISKYGLSVLMYLKLTSSGPVGVVLLISLLDNIAVGSHESPTAAFKAVMPVAVKANVAHAAAE